MPQKQRSSRIGKTYVDHKCHILIEVASRCLLVVCRQIEEDVMGQGPVLVVDDEPEMVALVSELLESEGYRVISATGGINGMGLLLMEQPAVVILDLDMPVVDGLHFARDVQIYGAAPPIILITGYNEAPQWARLMGAVAYLQKPFAVEALLDAIKDVYSRA